MTAPRRKQFNRQKRLQSAKSWLQEYKGQHIVRDYRKYYGVDFLTTFKELELLGVKISSEYREAVLKSVDSALEKRHQKKLTRQSELFEEYQDENFAYIIGYTSGGAPYGLTWDEWKECCGDDAE